MAYAALISLARTINRFLEFGHDDIQIVENSSPEMVELLEGEVVSLANVLERLDNNSRRFSSKRLNTLDAQIRDSIFKLEDVVESNLLHQFLSQSQNNIHQQEHPSFLFSLDIEELKPVIDSSIQMLNKFKAEYIYELSSNQLPKEEEEEEDDDDDDDEVIIKVEPRIFGILSNQLFMEIKTSMLDTKMGMLPSVLLGMGGIGKTTLARKLFQDPSVSSHFESRAFVTVGPQYQLEEVYLDILKQLEPNSTIIDHDEISLSGLKWRLQECWQDRKCMVVLDDIWDYEVLEYFLDLYCGHDHSGSYVLTTTRLCTAGTRSLYERRIPFLNKKESWDLLRAKVFGEDDDASLLCPPELERAGKKIAENCEGLPLTIVTVANILLSKHEITQELWNQVAANKKHDVYKEAYAKMHKVLLPSYYNLAQRLRILFLYMGVFPQNYEIPCSKLHMLWMAEAFIGVERDDYLVDKAVFKDLVDNSVLIVNSAATIGAYKTVSLHSSFWYVCKKEAEKSKFFHICTTLDDCLAQGINTQRRLCIYNPVLFAIKDAFEQMASVSAARSLLCTGAYHQYPVPVLCLGLRLLGVIYALPIRFYEFPMEVLKLIQVRYFALTCDGDLPASISKLWNLEYLIVNRHLSIKSAPSYLPVEIWDMQRLVHLQVMGSDLPEPPQGSEMMLYKLLDVSPHSCTRKILKRLPNLTKLGIRIELSPDDVVHQLLGCFNHIRHLRCLSTFKCVVVNPRITFEVAAPLPVPLRIFPQGLVKLTLSGLGYPWEKMSKISSLPFLKVLKLLNYAFRGAEWDVHDKEFPSLEVLMIEETDLVQWKIKDAYHIPYLRLLSIKHCYRLKEMPMGFTRYLNKIEIVDCNPLLVSSANKFKQVWKRINPWADTIDLDVHSSWDDDELKT